MFFGHMMAATVTIQTAQTVATNFYKGAVPAATNVTPSLVYTRTEADGTVDYYIFNIAPHGFVIVSATDIVKPVIAYSTESNFNTNFSKSGVKDWTDHAAQHIYGSIRQNMQANAHITYLWSAYQSGPYAPPSRSSSAIGPLLRTTWDQDPNYNDYCPYNPRDVQRAVTGCTATAMAQVMKFWNYPNQGTGSFSYDCYSSDSYHYGTLSANFNHGYTWSNMPYFSSDSDVARLMSDAGISVGMSYGDIAEGGSGGSVLQDEAWGNGGACAQKSYKTYFYYNPNTIQGIHASDYTSDQWFATLKAEIDAGRVVQYEGYDANQGGHTWVMDGYDANEMMHMNWGWSGYDNGYYAETALNAGGYSFNDGEGALIGIQPLYPYSVSIQAPSQVCLGTSVQISASGPASGTYSWYPTTGLACATCATTTATPTVSTLYTVTCDSAGVRVQHSVLVTVVPAVTAAFTVPNTVSCSEPATFTFNNTSKYASSYTWDFGDGTSIVSDSLPTHTYAGYGTYTVSLRVSGQCGTDSVIRSQYISVNNSVPGTTSRAICSGSTATLSASSPAGIVNWYTAPVGGTPVSAGTTSYTTPVLSTTTTYWAEAVVLGPLAGAGPGDNTIGAGTYYTGTTQHGVVFNCTTPEVLSYVDVYAQNDGSATVTLSNVYGVALQSTVINVTQGLNTVALNFNIPVGTGLQLSTDGSAVQFYRNNTGITYPYYSQDSAVVITGSDQGTGYYYFFYNWQLQSASCISNRVPVTAYVLNGSNSFSYSSAAGNSVTFTPAVTTASSYTWDFGDGTTSTQMSPVHQYTGTGPYTVSLTISNGSCSETVSGAISAAAGATAIQDIDVVQSMAAYPNPVKDILDIRVNAIQAANVQMTVYDMVGNVISTQNVQVNIGENNMTQNVSSYASGVYMIVMQTGSSRATSRFVKE
jgi:PKD repeat protein